MRPTIGDSAESLGFKIERKRSKIIGPQIITDLDFADDIALLSEEITSAQSFLQKLEIEAGKVGLHLNNTKTEVMVLNQEYNTPIKCISGHDLKKVTNYKYLGGQMESCERTGTTTKGWLGLP